MKVLIVSDLHVDINKCNYFGFMDKLDNVDLVLIAGDISGGYHSESVFLNKLKQLDKPFVVVVVSGVEVDRHPFLNGCVDEVHRVAILAHSTNDSDMPDRAASCLASIEEYQIADLRVLQFYFAPLLVLSRR